MTMDDMTPSGFVLSDSAMYAYSCQDVYPDLLSFAVAIPDSLKSLFLIPVNVQLATSKNKLPIIASRVAQLTGDSDVSDLFSYQTFVNYDNEPTAPSGEEGSINDAYQTPDDIPAAQPGDQFCGDTPRYDAIIHLPSDDSTYSDGDSTDLLVNEGYPYRMNEKPRHSSQVSPIRVRISLKPEILQEHVPGKTKKRAESCNVKFVSYYKPNRMYTFSVDSGNGPHAVRAILSELDEVTMTCDCPFWRWNGPEFHAKNHGFILGKPRGTAGPPDVRDPDRKHWLCKHAYSVLRHLEQHVQKIVDENWALDDDDLLEAIDSDWDSLEKEVEVPLEEIEEKDPVLEVVKAEDADEETREEFGDLPESESVEEFVPEEDPDLEEFEESEDVEDFGLYPENETESEKV